MQTNKQPDEATMEQKLSSLELYRKLRDEGTLTFQNELVYVSNRKDEYVKHLLLNGEVVYSEGYYEYNHGWSKSQEPTDYTLFMRGYPWEN